MSTNQCDGCRRGLPLRDGTHYNPDGSYDHIGCTAHLYQESAPTSENLTLGHVWHEGRCLLCSPNPCPIHEPYGYALWAERK